MWGFGAPQQHRPATALYALGALATVAALLLVGQARGWTIATLLHMAELPNLLVSLLALAAVAIELAAVLFIIEMIRDLALHLAPQWAAGQA